MLMVHTDSNLVTDAALSDLPTPPSLGPQHQPVPHHVLVQAMKDAALEKGYLVTRQELAMNRTGQRLFGVMDLQAPPSLFPWPADRGFAIGFRNSTNESLALRIVAGTRVFVCDNLALSGDLIALNRRNTTHLDLPAALSEAFDRYLAHASALHRQIEELEQTPISDAHAKSVIFDAFASKLLPPRLFDAVARNYFHPDPTMTDCVPRTTWALHNAFTRVFKRLRPTRAFAANIALGQFFGLTKRDAQ